MFAKSFEFVNYPFAENVQVQTKFSTQKKRAIKQTDSKKQVNVQTYKRRDGRKVLDVPVRRIGTTMNMSKPRVLNNDKRK